jgi:predicted phosphodiesterase
MLIDICSDIHMNTHEVRPIQIVFPTFRGRVLIIAGDVSNNLVDLNDFLDQAHQYYEMVVYVDGNHEHRLAVGTVRENMEKIQQICDSNEVEYLDGFDNCFFQFNDVAFIGGNCWYDWQAFTPRGVSFTKTFASWDDHSLDTNLNFGEYEWPNTFGRAQIENVKAAFEKANNDPTVSSIVMVTHTCPHPDGLIWIEGNEPNNVMGGSYAHSELLDIFSLNTRKKLKVWAYGHTHNRKRWIFDNVEMINNFYGYPWDENSNWAMSKVSI